MTEVCEGGVCSENGSGNYSQFCLVSLSMFFLSSVIHLGLGDTSW